MGVSLSELSIRVSRWVGGNNKTRIMLRAGAITLCGGLLFSATTTAGVAAAGPGGTGTSGTDLAQILLSPSLSGSKYGDLLGVDQSGTLVRCSASQGVALSKRTNVAAGWADLVPYAPGDWNRDGKNDVIGVDVKSGKMFLYPGNGQGGLGKAVQIGQGWGDFRIIPAGDLTGDGVIDLLAIKKSSGDLFLYAGNGKGGFKYPYPKVGNGWRGYDLHAAGDTSRDGKSDVLSVDSAGDLFFYAGKGNGTFTKKLQVGYGWKGYLLAAGADLNGDRIADVVSLDSNGQLSFYMGGGGGQFLRKITLTC